MKDLYHDTIYVSKLIHFGWNRINRFNPLKWQEHRLQKRCSFLNNKDKNWFVDRLNHATFEVKDVDETKTLTDANLALYDKIEVVGGLVDVSGKIDWHTDFKNHFTWPKGQKYFKYQIIGPQGGRDVKTVWDLSRCHHLLWLAAAYRQTKEEKYARRIVETIDDWIAENPFGESVNWVCPMDVSIRAVNWLFAVQMIAESDVVDMAFLKRLFINLYLHAAFVYSRLEKSYPFSENHYAADITGLLFIGYLFDIEKYGKRWLNYALQSMLYEIRTQILPSGAHFERSISYHRLVTELFFYSYLIIHKNTPNYIATDVTYRIRSMIDFIASYTKPNGFAPVLADNDNGRLLPFVKRDYREHYYLVDLAKGYGLLDTTHRRDLFDDAGFAFLKNDKFFLSFTNTPTSRYSRPWRAGGIGTHTHLDALSFELSKDGEDFIVDAGAYTYTESKEVRKEFRSMQKHNTMSVDEDNPYELSENFGISVKQKEAYIEPKPLVVKSDEIINSVSGSLYWQNKKVEHCRRIMMFRDHVLVEDQVRLIEGHNFNFRFHLDEGVIVSVTSDNLVILKKGNRELKFEVLSEIPCSISIEDDTVSPSYGVLKSAKTIVVSLKSDYDFNLQYKME